MPKGKRGPRPDPIEEPAETDPNIEDIVGAENIVDVDAPEVSQPAERQGYKCVEVGCTYQTGYLAEMEEHCAGTGHGGYKTETLDPQSTTQPELFSEPGIVHRNIEVRLPDETINGKQASLAELYQQTLDVEGRKSRAVSAFNAEIKALDEQMQEIARVLKTPFTYEKVDCEWKIIDGENARGLYRLDTGELLEKAALTEEDRATELARAAELNEAPETIGMAAQ